LVADRSIVDSLETAVCSVKRHDYAVLDSGKTVIFARSKGDTAALISSHELFESTGEIIWTPSGFVSRSALDTVPTPAEDREGWGALQKFRDAWGMARESIASAQSLIAPHVLVACEVQIDYRKP
jgi:hypothetical protein